MNSAIAEGRLRARRSMRINTAALRAILPRPDDDQTRRDNPLYVGDLSSPRIHPSASDDLIGSAAARLLST